MEKYENKLFKILPLFEGKILGTDLELPKEVAFEQYDAYLGMEIIEFSGMDEEPFIEILHWLKGLKLTGKNINQKQVKKVVFHCLKLLKG